MSSAADSNPHLPPDSVLTLAGPAEAELKEKRSRFIALAWPASSQEEIAARIAEASKRFHDSRHVTFGWRLGIPPLTSEGRNDDGEPSGTAGEPILAAIRRFEVIDTLVVVVRYFGGIKLGTGGLSRAYGGAADLALAEAKIREVLLGREFRLEFAYPLQKTIRHHLQNCEGRVVSEQYTESVAWKIWLPHSQCRRFSDGLTELTAGQVTTVPVDETIT